VLNTYEESFAFYAPMYRTMYAKKSRASCEHAIREINETLKLHDRTSYAAKLYAELDAARSKLQQYRAKFTFLKLRRGAYAVILNGTHIGSVHRTKQGRWSPTDRFECETTREDAAEVALYHHNLAKVI